MTNINELMIENHDLFSNDVFEGDLKLALNANLLKIEEKVKRYTQFENDQKAFLSEDYSDKNFHHYINNITSKYPEIMGDIMKISLQDGSFSQHMSNQYACFYAKQYKKNQDRLERNETAIDVGLLLFPIFAGPIGRAGATGIEMILGNRLSLWGLKSLNAQSFVTEISVTSRLGIIGKDLDQLNDLAKQCQRNEMSFFAESDEGKLENFRNCQIEYGEKKFISELGLVTSVASNFSANSLKILMKGIEKYRLLKAKKISVPSTDEVANYLYKNGFDKLEKGHVALEFKTPDKKTITVMDLSKIIASDDAHVRDLPPKYWRYVADSYKERLHMSKDEVESFVDSSIKMSYRTKLLMLTDESPLMDKMKIHGGIGLVTSSNSSELLPVEKALGLVIKRGTANEKIAEIGRLTVGGEVETAKYSAALIAQLSSLIIQDKNISRVFIYTSKKHSALYRRSMGVSTANMKDLNERDVLIELTRNDIEHMIDKNMLARKK